MVGHWSETRRRLSRVGGLGLRKKIGTPAKAEQNNGVGSKLFGNGSHVKQGLWFIWNGIFKIGHSIAFGENKRIISYDTHCAAWTILCIPFQEQAINFFYC